MKIKNTGNQYGIITVVIHWLMAVLIIGLIILGLYMVRIPISPQKLKLYGWHKEFGILVLALAMIRLGWRIGNITPTLPNTIPYWQQQAARGAHWAFYFFMVTVPLTGWMMSSIAGLPVSFFGLFVLPDLVSPNENYRILYSEIHEWLSYGLLATICLHTGAALKHHFINKDDILRRMLS